MRLNARTSFAVLVCAALLLTAAGLQAELIMVDDFESYPVGESIHLKASDDLGWGDPVPRWYVQRNSSALADPGTVTVERVDGDNCLQLINRDIDGEINSVFLSASITEYAIEDMGTIYMRFKADGPNDVIFCTNDLAPGYDYEGSGTTSAGDGYQGTANFGEMMSQCRLSGGEDFHARNGGAYEDVDMGQQANVWQELWIQYDNVMSQAKYFVCPNGGIPQQVMSTSGDWWGDRNPAGDGVYNLKWFIDMYPWPEANIQTIVWVDTIAIDTERLTTETPSCPIIPPYGDANMDGDVDLVDFVILKTHFGTGSTWEEGDFDEDGDVDLDDFVLLKTHFGVTYW